MSEFEYKVINKHLMLTRQNNRCSWQVEPNIFEAIKAECLFSAKDSSKQYLPRFACGYSEHLFPDLHKWRYAFSSDNPPETVSFRGRDKELAERIEAIDFSKPFDHNLAESIRQKFLKSPQKKTVEIDAVEIAENENREAE
jgi:hypothetical protein